MVARSLLARPLLAVASRPAAALSRPCPTAARMYSTPSEEAVKGQKHGKSPETLQKEHKPPGDIHDKTATPNQQATQSEQGVHAEREHGHKSPEQLQKETTPKN